MIGFEPNQITYILIPPGGEPDISVGFCVIGENAEIPYKGALIVYDPKAAERNDPMNRFIEFENGQIMCVSGAFAIVNKKDDEYYSLTDEQINDFYEEFRYPHLFLMMMDKFMIFERPSHTELNMLRAFDLANGVEENGEH